MAGPHLHLDCFAGIAGDMALAALLDCGASEQAVRAGLATLEYPGWELSLERRAVQGIEALDAQVRIFVDDPHHRPWREIRDRIGAASLPKGAKARALEIFGRLAAAEAKVHGRPVDEVHFHEVGALDSIVDIVGVALALDDLAPQRVTCTPVPVGSGWVDTAHGRLPVPAPATAELLVGVPTRPSGGAGELVTPTGAAIVAATVDEFVDWPSFSPSAIGYGAGDRVLADRPNLLRVLVGAESADATAASSDHEWDAWELRANIDDMAGEDHGFLLRSLLEAGALDAWFSPIQMKKDRPAVQVSALTSAGQLEAVADALLRHSTSAGLRMDRVRRRCLPRSMIVVQTEYGPIRVKRIEAPDGPRLTPEYDDCAAAASKAGVSLRTVRAAAQSAVE